MQFLDAIKSEQERKERKRKLEDAEEVKGFKEYVLLLLPLTFLPFCGC